jgi:hypothetical protein
MRTCRSRLGQGRYRYRRSGLRPAPQRPPEPGASGGGRVAADSSSYSSMMITSASLGCVGQARVVPAAVLRQLTDPTSEWDAAASAFWQRALGTQTGCKPASFSSRFPRAAARTSPRDRLGRAAAAVGTPAPAPAGAAGPGLSALTLRICCRPRSRTSTGALRRTCLPR